MVKTIVGGGSSPTFAVLSSKEQIFPFCSLYSASSLMWLSRGPIISSKV